MEENIYVMVGLVVSIIVIFYPAAKEKGEKKNRVAKSELHVRDRYAVADLIQKEWADRQG